jgi:hypothetical protein
VNVRAVAQAPGSFAPEAEPAYAPPADLRRDRFTA